MERTAILIRTVGSEESNVGKLGSHSAKGQTCDGNPGKATDIRIFPVSPVPFYSVNRFVNNHTAQFLIDKGIVITLLK